MILLALAITGVMVAAAGSLRAAGASLVRTPRADALHDAAEGNRRAAAVARLLEDRASIQPSISLVHSVLLAMAVMPAVWAAVMVFSGWALAFALLAFGAGLVALVELFPRTFGRSHPRRVAYWFWWLLTAAIAVGRRTVDLVIDEDDEPEPHPDYDHDEADREEIRLISSVLEFSDAIVREVMVPRTDMVTLSSRLTMREARDQAVGSGFSRIPVTGEGADDIIGLLYAKDLLRLVGEYSPDTPLPEIIRPVHFVPETKTVRGLLREMQTSQVHMAVAVDEFGGTAGLVTIEDLLEELVGEIVDEYDNEPPMVQTLEDGAYLVDARFAVDDLNRMIGGQLPDEEWDTVGGLVLGLAGRVPNIGESFEYGGARLTSERVQGRRVERVRVQVLEPPVDGK